MRISLAEIEEPIETDYIPSYWIMSNNPKPGNKSKRLTPKRRGINLKEKHFLKFVQVRDHFNLVNWGDLIDILYDLHVTDGRVKRL